MDYSLMYDEVLNHEDTFLPTVSIQLKDVYPDTEPDTIMNNPAESNGDSAAGGIHALDALQPQEINTLNDTEIESLLALYESSKPSFSILPSKKPRGKPYFIDDKERILTTKRNEPIHLQLDYCEPGQKILLTLRYTDQDYYDRPMVCNGCKHDYKGCTSTVDHNNANFCVRSRDGSVEYMMLREGAAYHPTAVITVTAKHELVDLSAAFKCRNSCSEHKKYGGNRTLRLTLLDEQEQERCRNEWSLRVCESAKRDHNLFLSKAGPSSSDDAAVPSVLRQLIVATPPTLAPQNSFAQVPPPTKRVKLEEEPVIHYIDDASPSTQKTVEGQTVFECVSSTFTAHASHAGSYRRNSNKTTFPVSSSKSSGVMSVPGCFEAKPLLPIAPPAPAVAEAPAVVPVVVYPTNEADKTLLVSFAERLGMSIYNVQS